MGMKYRSKKMEAMSSDSLPWSSGHGNDQETEVDELHGEDQEGREGRVYGVLGMPRRIPPGSVAWTGSMWRRAVGLCLSH